MLFRTVMMTVENPIEGLMLLRFTSFTKKGLFNDRVFFLPWKMKSPFVLVFALLMIASLVTEGECFQPAKVP